MSESPNLPRRLADFEILRRLGVGGMAEVFLAKKRGAEDTYKLLVVKRILPAHGSSRRFRAMFAEEAQLATRLNHPNIVQVYEFQDYGDEGQLLSMEYVEGPDLKKLARAAQAKHQRLPPHVAAYIVSEVARGLHYAHERRDEGGVPLDIVHRDVSPQNVLISFDGSVKIADFGIATANLFREEAGVLKGKTGYMSPEQARGERVDRRTDLYSLGVVFHEILTGRPLHGAAEGAELLEAVRAGVVEPPSTFARDIPQEFEAIVMRALSRSPDDRFQTARDMAAAITRALFQKQELVDAHVVETVVDRLVSREHTEPGVHGPSEVAGDSQYGDSRYGGASEPPGVVSDGADHAFDRDEPTGPGRSFGPRWARSRRGREVRHAAVVTLRLHGLTELEAMIGSAAAARFVEQLRSTLDEIAFKRGARWSWETKEVDPGASGALTANARAVVGLTANPSRAPIDAVWLAVDVHEAVQGTSDDLPVKLSASVGIVRGLVSGERDAAGHLIHHELRKPADYLAELIGQRAPPGVSWVAGGLYRLVRRDFVWGDAPTIEIEDAKDRDLPEHMRIYSLLRPLTREEKLQQMAAAPSDLIGRDAELGELQAAYYSIVRAGDAQAQLAARVVSGEMGIGKTALVSTFLAELPPDARILRVECSPAKSELPLANIAEWVRQLTGVQIGQPLEQAAELIGQALEQLAEDENGPEIVTRMAQLATGVVVAALDEGDVAHARNLIAAGLRRFLVRASLEAPLVVLVDGLQWSDRQSLELIAELSRVLEPLSVLLLLVTRPEQRVLSYLDGVLRVELKGLSAENQVRLLQTRLGVQRGVPQVCADLLPRAAGNPFFLLEMVDALLERGVLEIQDAGQGEQVLIRAERTDDAAIPLPSTLEQLIADRLMELPFEEQTIVDWLAVAGGPLSSEDLSMLSGQEVDGAVAALVGRGLCEARDDLVEVKHPLTRDVAYRALEAKQRVSMHRTLGTRLANSPRGHGLSAAIVARHLARGGVKSTAADFYLEAAAVARSSYQTRAATRYSRRALALLSSDDPRRLEAHETLEGIFRNQSRWRERRYHLGQLRRLAKLSQKPFWVGLALQRTARFELDAGHLAKALHAGLASERVAAQGRSSVVQVQSQALIAEVLRNLGDMQGALAAADRALSTAGSPGVPAYLRAEVLRNRGALLRRVGRVHESIDAQAEAIAVFRKVGARRMEARAKNSLAFGMFVLGRFEDGIALGLESIRIDLSIGGRLQLAKTLCTIGQCYAALGDLPRGIAYLKRAREAHERYGDQDSRADTFLSNAEVLLESGDLAAVETLVRDAGALTAVTGNTYDSVHEKILRALLARENGDAGAAVMHAFDARQAAEAQAYVAFHFYAMAVEAAARVDIGEQHTGILLATTAMGAIETLQGSEYGLATRTLCCQALRKAGSPQAEAIADRARKYAETLLEYVVDPRHQALFVKRRFVAELLADRPVQEARPFSGRGLVSVPGEPPTSEAVRSNGGGGNVSSS